MASFVKGHTSGQKQARLDILKALQEAKDKSIGESSVLLYGLAEAIKIVNNLKIR